jgi:trigger factor
MEIRSMYERAVSDLKARGMKEQDIKLNPEVFEAQAKRRVALSLLLNGFAQANNIVAGDAQVRAKVDEFAQSYEDPSEVVAWYYQDKPSAWAKSRPWSSRTTSLTRSWPRPRSPTSRPRWNN